MKKALYRALAWIDGYWHVYVCNWVERLSEEDD